MHDLGSSISFHRKTGHGVVSVRIQPNLLHSCTKLILVGTFNVLYFVKLPRQYLGRFL